MKRRERGPRSKKESFKVAFFIFIELLLLLFFFLIFFYLFIYFFFLQNPFSKFYVKKKKKNYGINRIDYLFLFLFSLSVKDFRVTYGEFLIEQTCSVLIHSYYSSFFFYRFSETCKLFSFHFH